MLSGFLVVLRTLTTIAAVALVLSRIKRANLNKKQQQVTLGVVFGIGGVLSILDPIMLEDGIIIDGRNLFVAFSGAFTGPYGAAISLIMVSGVRLLIGGYGMLPAILSASLSALIGVLWYLRYSRKHQKNMTDLAVLGIALCSTTFVILLIPYPTGLDVFRQVAPYLMLMYVFGSLIFGSLIIKEEFFVDESINYKDMAHLDPLTGALNRRGLFEEFSKITKRKPLSDEGFGNLIIVVDVDNFKEYNDTYGHEFGDLILSKIVEVINSSVRPHDLVCRLGGDEFSVCIFNVSLKQASFLVSRLQKRLNIDFTHTQLKQPEKISVSVGAVFTDDAYASLSDVLKVADEQLIDVKRAGKNDYRLLKISPKDDFEQVPVAL